MNLSALVCIGVNVVNGQFGGPFWSDWLDWGACSATCGDGTRQRLRYCLGSLDTTACGPDNTEIEACPDIPACPSWTVWSEWGDCSVDCDGGIRSRTRTCDSGNEQDCAGSPTNDEQCNQQPCGRQMVYWDFVYTEGEYVGVNAEFLSGEGAFLQQCANYCASFQGCIGIAVTTIRMPNQPEANQCYINSSPYTTAPICWGTNCADPDNMLQTIQIGVFQDYYDENPTNLPATTPTGSLDTQSDGTIDQFRVRNHYFCRI